MISEPCLISTKLQRDLLKALESARTRFAIAMAAETKLTPLDRWQYYRETDERMRRCAKKLRAPDSFWLPESPKIVNTLETLRQLPAHGKAPLLCRILREIVSELE